MFGGGLAAQAFQNNLRSERERAAMQQGQAQGLFGGLGQSLPYHNSGGITPQIRFKEDLTFKEELQEEIDDWLRDV